MSNIPNNNIYKNIKKVLVVFLLCFIGLIVYITYFQVFKAEEVAKSSHNRRLQAKRNEILRGTIYDRNMKPLTASKKISKLNQERTYIYNDIFANVIGYVSPRYGITGLEKAYDESLTGTDTLDISSVFKLFEDESEKVGNNLKTTLDYNVQKKAYDMLGDRRGAVVVLNPKTGEVISMVSKPSYNPNKLEEQWKTISTSEEKPLYNRATYGLYPPGSIFKIVTAVSALENMNGVKQRTFKDRGRIVFNSKESLENYNGKVLGNLSLKRAFAKSSNVVFGTLGLELGNDKLKQTSEKFYLNKDIPIDDFITKQSRFPALKSYEKGNIAQSAIGQASVLTTPMQMALVASTIANDGKMMKPTLVKQVLSPKGDKIKEAKPESLGQITSKENSAVMKEFMRSVVKDGTGKKADINGLSVCGKTGTADNSMGNKQPHSWFVGFAPYDNPQVAIAVIVENCEISGESSKIAGEIIKEYIKK